MSTKSLQFKITLMMVCAIVVSMFVTTVIAGVIIGKLTNNLSNNTLYLLCENGEKNIDSYLDSVMRSVGTVSQFAREELKNEDISDLSEHVARVKGAFAHAANNTDGILTYYYRIDPDVSKTEKGF